MKIDERKYVLTKIASSGKKLYLTVSMSCEDIKVKNYYINSCFEGMFIKIDDDTFSVYAEIIEGNIVGEILFDTIKNNLNKPFKLFVRNRIGNQTYEYFVNILVEQDDIYFSSKDIYRFEHTLGYDFLFKDIKALQSKKPFKQQVGMITADKVLTGDDGVEIEIHIPEALFDLPSNSLLLKEQSSSLLSAEFCLIWEDLNEKNRLYFKNFKILTSSTSILLSYDEIDKVGRFLTEKSRFNFYLIDVNNKKYPIYCNCDERDKVIPLITKECKSEIVFKNKMLLQICVNGGFSFSLERIVNECGSLLLKLEKSTYPVIVKRFLLQRVNTDIFFELPYQIVNENDFEVCYLVDIVFPQECLDFLPGVHQFWADVEDGGICRYPVKIFYEKWLKENTFLLIPHPYVEIDGQCYDIGYYTDGTTALKCSILKKVMRTQIISSGLYNDTIICEMKIYNDFLLNMINCVQLLSEDGELFKPSYDVEYTSNYMQLRIHFSVYEMDFSKIEQSYELLISFKNCNTPIAIENNFFRPAVNGRENQFFSSVYAFNNKMFRRFWGNHCLGSYHFGVTEDLQFAKLVEYYLENDSLYLKIDIHDDFCAFIKNNDDLKLVLKNIFNDTETVFSAVCKNTYFEFNVPIRELSLSADFFNIPLTTAYLPFIQLNDDKISYLQLELGNNLLFDYKNRKKIQIKREEGKLRIEIQEVFIYEDPERLKKCRSIVTKAKNDIIKRPRKIWLIGENYGLSARDNGLAFFEYCMNNISEIQAEVYYVTKTENKDLDILKPYKDHVVHYDSDQHIYLDTQAEFYIVSHGVRDVLPSLYHNSINEFRKPIIYLQHGIAAMKKFYISNTSYGSAIRRFIVSSTQEMKFMVTNKQFWPQEVAITGLARYDKLKSVISENSYIWISPTYRDGLIKSEKNFYASEYYQKYSELLSDEDLISCMRKAGLRIVFSLHNDLEKFRNSFTVFENDIVHITDVHSEKISERICACRMMLTDYSSIVWDAIYLDKPVVFFQFDRIAYDKDRGSYVDMDKDLPGPVVKTVAEAVKEIIKIVNNNFVMEPEFKERANKYYNYRDCGNCKRIYEAILKYRKELL